MYRFIKFYCALSLVALAFAQCTKDFTNDLFVGESLNPSATKIINTSRSAIEGRLLVKFNDSAALAFENGTRSGNGVTRSNIAPLNDILLDIDAVSIERLFPVDVRHEERAREAGMHLWYIVKFGKEQSLDKVAQALAEIGEVDIIEFDTKISFVEPVKGIAPAVTQTRTSSASTQEDKPFFNDPLFKEQWDLHNTGNKERNTFAVAGMDINVCEAWKYTTGDPSVVVAVIDQGVDYTHPDLAANMWVNEDEIADNNIDDDKNGYVDDIHGYNFVDEGPISWNKSGDVGHGTHVAGTIAAVSNNGIGISGIAGGDGSPNSGVKIMSVQIFSGGNGSTAAEANAFYYAANNGAVISNNSWGEVDPTIGYKSDENFKKNNSALYIAIEYFRKNAKHPNLTGGFSLFAAGNKGKSQIGYPGAYSNNIAVTSFGIAGWPAYYTNYGAGANIAAPGGDEKLGLNADILSTISPGYEDDYWYYEGDKYYYWMQGTSMACPHATGVAALGLSYAKKLGKTLTADEFKNLFLVSVNGMDSLLAANAEYSIYAGQIGTGRIDAFQFLMNLEGIGCIPVPRGQTNFQIDVNKYMADSKTNIKLIDIEISEADMARLGMKNKPRYSSTYNTFYVTCTNSGSAIITIKMIGGGDSVGTDEKQGGIEITKKFALIVRDGFAENGGWL